MLGKEALLDFGLKCLNLRKWVRIGLERGHHQWQATRYSFPTFSGKKKGPAPTLGHHLHGLSHLLLSFHQLTGDTRVHGVLGRGEDVSHTPSTVRFALPSVRKMLEKSSSPKTMANFWQQKSSCFYPTSWFMVQPPNFRCDSLGCFVGKESVWETRIRKAKNVWTLFWFRSFVHLRWKFKEPQSPHLEAPCAGCGVWDLEIGRTCWRMVGRGSIIDHGKSKLISTPEISFWMEVWVSLQLDQKKIWITLRWSNIAMENEPFEDVLPIKHGDIPWLC